MIDKIIQSDKIDKIIDIDKIDLNEQMDKLDKIDKINIGKIDAQILKSQYNIDKLKRIDDFYNISGIKNGNERCIRVL